ncbi:sulfatase [Litoribacter ruber]|uniref:sulfatase family protein n=1 Tax=Litoribacter ruber TaxID=702568 RepID=UPI001BD9A408|nr:sulfatase [Litoribacter ruber]MBT0812410.1 sulfatase [Litoribacter ruber]
MNTEMTRGYSFILLMLWFALGFSSCSMDEKVVESKPNILFIMTDDHALQAISAYGHPLSQLAPTPNIDRIASSGALFTSNFCGNSICGPSRATVLTGKHSHKNGFMRNTNIGFDGTQQTLPKILGKNGYQTAIIGKWHLVSEPTGFDHWEILHDQGEYNNPDFITIQDTTQKFGYVTDLITDMTKDWLDKRDPEKPFYLMMHHKAPHRNWVPAERHYHLYDDTEFPMPDNYFDDYEGRYAASQQEMNIYRDMFEGHNLKLSTEKGVDSLRYDPWPHVFMGRMTDEEKETFWKAYHKKNESYFELDPADSVAIAKWKFQRYMQDYLAVIKSVDESVGEILDYLDENGLSENTLVVYTSDQGFYLGEHGWFDKRFMYEESMLMPLMIRYPGYIGEGLQVSNLTQNIDFAPTFLDYVGLQIPDDMQGESFRPLLENSTPEDWRQSLYYHYYEFPGFHSVRKHYGVRDERHKLIYFYEEDKWELFDLEKDPTEMNNIYGLEGTEEITDRMTHELRALQDKYEVPEDHR